MNGLPAILLSIGMIAAFVLIGRGAYMLAKGQDRKQAWLMILASLVLLINVLIWAIPVPVR
jgi:hypothetical protein